MRYKFVFWGQVFAAVGAVLVIFYHRSYRNELQKTSFAVNQEIISGCLTPNEYAFLDSISSNNIILLGEQQHGDGTTVEKKIEMIRYLHEKYHFNEVAFEANLLDCDYLGNQLLTGHPNLETKINTLYPFWGGTTQFQNLFDYISASAKTSDPLAISGVDIQLQTDTSDYVLKEIKASGLNEKSEVIEQYSFLKSNYNLIKSSVRLPLTKNKKEELFRSLNVLDSLVFKQPKIAAKDSLVAFYLTALSGYLKPQVQGVSLDRQREIRDSLMASVALHLLKTTANKKLIIWAANTHIARTANLATQSLIVGKKHSMGDYLYQDKSILCYALAFTSYEGQTLNIATEQHNLINESIEGGFEDALHNAGITECAWNFRKSDKQCSTGLIYSKIFGHSNLVTNLEDVVDGVYFINTMKASNEIN